MSLSRVNNILLTGATGFIGQNLVPLLLANNYNISVIGRNYEKAKQFDWFKNVEFIELDLYKDNKTIKIYENTGLIHLAWEGLPNYTSLSHFEKNLIHDYKFLKSMILSGVKKVLVSGTCFEYGFQNGAIHSNAKTYPNNSYAFAKDCLRKQLEFLSISNPFCLQWARLFYIYGKGQNSNSLLSQLDSAIDNNYEYFNMSNGDQLRDYLPVSEVVKQLLQLFTNNLHGTFNICSGKPISILNLVKKRIKERQSKIKLNLGHFPYSKHEPMEFWGISDIN